MIDLAHKWEIVGADGSRATFGDPTDPDFVGYLREASGLDSAGVRYQTIDIPMTDGAITTDAYYSARSITLEGMIWPDPVSLVNVRTEKLQRATNAMRADSIIRWWPTGMSPLQVAVRRADPLRIRAGRPRQFSLSVIASDPRIYSQDERSFTGATPTLISGSTYGVTINAVNEGTVAAPWEARIYGPMTNPELRNVTTGEKIVTSGLTVSAGDFLSYDSAARTVKLNGTVNKYADVTFLQTSWFGLIPGLNELSGRGTSTNADTYATLTYRAAWL